MQNGTHGTIEFHTNVKPEIINAWRAQSLEKDGRRDFRLVVAKERGSSEPAPHAVIYEAYDVENPVSIAALLCANGNKVYHTKVTIYGHGPP